MSSRAPGRGLLLVCLAGLLWGTIGPAVDVVHARSSLSPLTIGGYRAVVAGLALALAVTLTRRGARCAALLRAHRRRVVLVGSLTAVFQMLFFVAVVLVGVSVTTVVCLGLPPLLLLLVTSAERRRAPSRAEVLTVVAALAGLATVSLAGATGPARDHPVWGVLAALGSGAAYAASAHLSTPLSRASDGVTITALTMGVAACVLVPAGALAVVLGGGPWSTSDPVAWSLVGYLGVVTMGLAYVLLFEGLRTTSSGAAVVATLLEPVTAVLIAVVLLGERLSPAGAVGVLLVVAAIGSLGRRSPDPPPPQ